jgi:hypothetical protein
MIHLYINYDSEFEIDEVSKSSFDFYNKNENIIKINTYKQFIKEDNIKEDNKRNIKIINEKYLKKAKKEYKLDYDKLKYNYEIKNSVNKINRKHLSTINEIKCKDILI